MGVPAAVYPSDMRVKVTTTGLYTYPDLAVVCGKAQFEDVLGDSLLNPTVLVEVLSPSTEAYDRGAKFAHYRALASLCDYLLVAPDQPQIEHDVRQPDGSWLLHVYTGLEAVIILTALGCELPLAEVYDKVEWIAGAPGRTAAATGAGRCRRRVQYLKKKAASILSVRRGAF